MNVLFSIIVPVYNVEKYLFKCIKSILNQSYDNWELLLIDDGSKDKSRLICEEFARKDSRVKVFHKKNGGVSSARNMGLDNAIGNWITFVDSDDELLPMALQNYYNVIRCNNDLDVIKGGYYKVNEILDSILLYSCHNDEIVYSQAKGVELLNGDCCYHGFLWNECIRRNIIGELRFDESICWNEDHLFSYECFIRAKMMYFMAEPVYLYYIRSRESLSNIKDPTIVLNTCAKIYTYRKTMLSENSTAKRIEKQFEDNYVNMFHFSMKLLSPSKYSFKYLEFFRENVLHKDILIKDLSAKIYLDSSKNIYIAYYLYVLFRYIYILFRRFYRIFIL